MNPIRQSFNRAAPAYRSVAALQKDVAHQLVDLLDDQSLANGKGRILDAGCGTGYGLDLLPARYPDASIIALDFAEAMLKQLQPSFAGIRIQSDLQALPLQTATIDVYLSSLAWQWCNSTLAVAEAARVLKPRGELLVTTLTTGTFSEFANALMHSGLSQAQHLLRFTTAQEIHDALRAANLEIVRLDVKPITTWHPDFKSLRHSIRGVGANHLATSTTASISRQARTQLLQSFERQRTAAGLPLTYNVLFIHARKT